MTQPEISNTGAGRVSIDWYYGVDGAYHWDAQVVGLASIGRGTEATLADALEAGARAIQEHVGLAMR